MIHRLVCKTFEIRIDNVKTGRIEYRDYSMIVKAGDEKIAIESAIKYAKECLKMYRKGSTFTIVEQ